VKQHTDNPIITRMYIKMQCSIKDLSLFPLHRDFKIVSANMKKKKS